MGEIDHGNARRVVESWEQPATWAVASQFGSLEAYARGAHSGVFGGRLDYRFDTTNNDYVAFKPRDPLAIGSATAVGLWVYGNNSGHLVQVQLIDQGGEIVQFPLGKLGGPEWAWIQMSIRGVASSRQSPGRRKQQRQAGR